MGGREASPRLTLLLATMRTNTSHRCGHPAQESCRPLVLVSVQQDRFISVNPAHNMETPPLGGHSIAV